MSERVDPAILLRALKNTLKQRSNTEAIISDLAQTLNLDFLVTGLDGNILYGNPGELPHSFEISHGETKIGQLKTNLNSGKILQSLINNLISKEVERKKLGNEILGLYREINMIYNFSEMISEKIDSSSIAMTALDEASQIIDITHGSVFILNEDTGMVEQVARVGHNPNPAKSIENQNHILKVLIEKGTSLIIPKEAIKKNSALNHLKAVMYAPLKVKHRTLGLIVLGNQNEKEFTAAELKLLTTIALQSAAAMESAQLYQKGLMEAREREEAIMKIHQASQKFVPHEFIKSLGKEHLTEVALGDQVEREVTVMFVDIRGFTTLSENMAPTENFFFINSFNKRMGPVIRKNKGFIMQYLGDGFMAIFPTGSESALRAAVEIQNSLKLYNEERFEKDRKPVKIGIGMQNGKLIMGITGDMERMDAAIISDTVNTAARIEGLSKHYGTSILLTDLCKKGITNPDEFNFRFLGFVQVQGKKKPIKLYECIDGDEEELLNHKQRTRKTFKKAMELYLNKEFALAAVTFQKIVKENREDHTAKLFLNRSAHLITQEIGDDWKGVEAMDTK